MRSSIGIVASARHAAGGGGWTPADVTTQLWLDAADTATITHSSGAVSQWADKSGNARHFAQATAGAKPTTASVTQNGKNVVAFDGGDWMQAATAADWTFLHDGTNYLVCIVAKVTSANGGLFSNVDGSNTTRGAYVHKSNSDVWHIVTRNSSPPFAVLNQAAAGMSTTAYHVLTVYSDPDNATAASRSSIYLDDGAAISGNTQTNAVSTASPNYPPIIGSLLLAGGTPGASYFVTGQYAELVVVSGAAATEVNRAAFVDYAQTKWGL